MLAGRQVAGNPHPPYISLRGESHAWAGRPAPPGPGGCSHSVRVSHSGADPQIAALPGLVGHATGTAADPNGPAS